MSSRQKKKKETPVRKSSVRGSTIKGRSEDSTVSAEPVDKPDPKNVILKELLESLLPAVTIKSEVKKSFAKLTFFNLNAYNGWLGPNGFQGFGTYKFSDGSSFRGAFENSLTKGGGRYNYARGYVYDGEFLAGRRHGYGQYKARRFHYDGYFKNGVFHGEGVWKSKTEEQKGIFCEGRITHGEVRDSSGIFEGTFDESDLRKRGKFTFKNGNTYVGTWSDDLFWGYGVYNWIQEGIPKTKAETKYIGYWLNGERYALGMLTFRQRYIICQWNSDKKSGAGVIIACNGNCYASTNMYTNNQYNGSTRITLCKESHEILRYLIQLTTPAISYETMEEKRDVLMEKIQELIEGFAESPTPVDPIRIPHYEIADLPGMKNTSSEISYLQQVLIENYKHFMSIYKRYTHPDDEYMNNLGLNLFYMDVFHKVRDVNVQNCLKEGHTQIRHQCEYSDYKKSCDSFLAAVPFYEFFQHFIRITNILMENEELKLAAERLRPTFFGHLATQVLLVLRILQSHQLPEFLVREAISANRPATIALLQSMKKLSPGDKTIRTAYRFLKTKVVVDGKSTNFIQAVDRYFENIFQDGVLCNSEIEMSDMELIEIVLYTCQLKLAKAEMRKAKELEEQMKKDIIKEL